VQIAAAPERRLEIIDDHTLERYRRQVMLLGEEAQARLCDARVFIAGAGGLGCPAALYLAAAGVGEIRLVDGDIVEPTNLNRQVLHWDEDVGREKVVSAAEKLRALNPEIVVDARPACIDAGNVDDLVGDAHLIIDAVDNFPARYLLNRSAREKNLPLVHGAVCGFDGQATTVLPGRTACLRCIFPDPPPAETSPVIGVTPGIIGLIQANEAIKYLTGTGELLTDRLLIWDGLTTTMVILPVERRKDCEECGTGLNAGDAGR
jgi:molybdopterin/thiamine biosynthesis adenylyltransferase